MEARGEPVDDAHEPAGDEDHAEDHPAVPGHTAQDVVLMPRAEEHRRMEEDSRGDGRNAEPEAPGVPERRAGARGQLSGRRRVAQLSRIQGSVVSTDSRTAFQSGARSGW